MLESSNPCKVCGARPVKTSFPGTSLFRSGCPNGHGVYWFDCDYLWFDSEMEAIARWNHDNPLPGDDLQVRVVRLEAEMRDAYSLIAQLKEYANNYLWDAAVKWLTKHEEYKPVERG